MEDFINYSTFHKYSTIFDKSLEQLCGNTVEKWIVEEFIDFPHSYILPCSTNFLNNVAETSKEDGM